MLSLVLRIPFIDSFKPITKKLNEDLKFG